MSVKPKIVISGDSVRIQDADAGEFEEGDEIEVEIDGKIEKKVVKKTELLQGEVIRIFTHKPNSFEFGRAGSRHKIHYYSKEDGLRKIEVAKELTTKTVELGLDDLKGSSK